MFEVKNWSVEHATIPDRLAVNDASFKVSKGEVVGFAGLMGAGRTELARSLFGRTYGQYLGGELLINGEKKNLTNVQGAINAGLAYVPEDRKTLGLNLLDSIQRTIVSANLKAIIKGGLLDLSEETSVAEKYRKDLQIKTSSVRDGVTTLSGGNQQKVVLAKWLLAEPKVLLLDEPTRGIDVGAKYEIYTIIANLAAQGKSIIMISSEMSELIGMSDRIMVMCDGRLTGEINGQDATQENIMTLATQFE